MSTPAREPSADELSAMAYVDGELDADARRQFEVTLASRADLRREIARWQRLDVLARHAAGPEPLDHEWRALELDPLQRAGTSLAWVLTCAGAAALAVFALFWLWTSSAHVVLKLATSAVALGVLLLFITTLRARLRTRHLDPYTDIER